MNNARAYSYIERYGRFAPDNAYHVIRRPPAAWTAFLWNERFISSLDCAGRGMAMFKDTAHHRAVLRRAHSPRMDSVSTSTTGPRVLHGAPSGHAGIAPVRTPIQ